MILEAEALCRFLKGLAVPVVVEDSGHAPGTQTRALRDVEILPGVVVEVREFGAPGPAAEAGVPVVRNLPVAFRIRRIEEVRMLDRGQLVRIEGLGFALVHFA